MILAFGHQSRVGKDTAAQAAYEHLRTNGIAAGRASFAGRLKEVAHALFQEHGLRPGPFYETPEGAPLRDVPLCGGCPPPEEKRRCPGRLHITPVQVWIEVGQKMRDIHPTVWVDQVIGLAQPGRVLIVSDLRFQNEADAVRAAGGWCVRVRRPGAPAPKGSDDRLNPGFEWDAEIMNSGTVDDLREKARSLAMSFACRPSALEALGLPQPSA